MSKQSVCTTGAHAFRINEKDTFIYSGEVHYFRIPTRHWGKHLKALKDANCNAVSSYVPWSWHESEEGSIDLNGRTHPQRNLLGFLKLAKEHDLFVTLKPGPYALAELTDQGMPAWVTRDYPETLALDASGNIWGPAFVSYSSSVFRRKAARWLRAFVKRVVLKHQHGGAGSLVLMQLCNEIGMFQWLGGKGDYSKAGIADWRRYLETQFPEVDQIAEIIRRPVAAHKDVMPPAEVCSSPGEFALYRLWHDFHRWLYADYVDFLYRTMRDAGAQVPVFTNVGGWVWGRAHEFPLNGTFQRETIDRHPDILYGIDHIPEFVSPNNLHDGIVANHVCLELQRDKGPLYSAELQCGSREHGVQPYPQEMALFYRLGIAHGLTAMNFYMFAQGKNPKGRGVDGPMFYWYNAVDYKAAHQPVYPEIRMLGSWLKANGSSLVDALEPSELAVGFYAPLNETEFLVPKLQKQTRLDVGKSGLQFDPVHLRDDALFDGVLRHLAKRSIPHRFFDLSRPLADLKKYKRLVVVNNEVMDGETQKKLCRYVKEGGTLVIFPVLPSRDLTLQPCSIMADSFGLTVGKHTGSNRVYTGTLKDVPVGGGPFRVSGKGARIIVRDADGKTAGVEKKYGRGTVRLFGFMLHYSSQEHPLLWDEMMGLNEVNRNAWTDGEMLHVAARFSDKGSFLFVGNFHRMPVTERVWVRSRRSGKAIDLGLVDIGMLSGRLLPLETPLSKGLELVYALGEMHQHSAGRNTCRFELCGPDGSHGRVALKSAKVIKRVTIDGVEIQVKRQNRLYTGEYRQAGFIQTVNIEYY
ncbi:MAG: beta-galactosidase [Verrucomicrobia bacterium]|nr:beta-galactosidase [Verrucomicrobiota bacterium]